jgi:hypothetical protein
MAAHILFVSRWKAYYLDLTPQGTHLLALVLGPITGDRIVVYIGLSRQLSKRQVRSQYHHDEQRRRIPVEEPSS